MRRRGSGGTGEGTAVTPLSAEERKKIERLLESDPRLQG